VSRVRQIHRWVSIVFTLTVIANFVALGLQSPSTWVGYLAIPPLLVLLGTGLALFVLPYLARGRATRSAR